MRKLFFIAVMCAVVLMGCNKDDQGQGWYKESDLVAFKVKIDLMPSINSPVQYGTKLYSAELDNGTFDKVIDKLEIFVFDGQTGELDGFEMRNKPTQAELQSLSVRCKSGLKKIYAVANSTASWSGIVNENDFLNVRGNLLEDNYSHFMMNGEATENIKANSNISITLRRIACKVVVKSLKTSFAGTPYEGKSLQNVRVYLTNVNGNATMATSDIPADADIFNQGGYSSSDVALFKSAKLEYLASEMGVVNDGGTRGKDYLFCYPNMLEQEDDNNRFTRLVVEGTIDGTKYYYPININRENYGWNSSIDHKGVKSNTSYTYDITILRPGSKDPDEVVDLATFKIGVTIADWNVVPDSIIEF